MRDELLNYYERELGFLRQMGAEFATRYPKVASRLQLEPTRCEDPHVERLIESFALLSARIHLKLDDEFPEITQSLLDIVYPHFNRPIPSMTVVEFRPDPQQSRLTSPLEVPRGTPLYSRAVSGSPCKFQTCYDTTVLPVRVAEAQWRTPDRVDFPLRAQNSAAVLRLELHCWPDVAFDELRPGTLRFYLNAEGALAFTLYELLANSCTDVVLRNPAPRFVQSPLALPFGALRPVGFAGGDAMLPYPRRSMNGYRLLQEYAAFPEKFFFFDLDHMDALQFMGAKDKVEILFLIAPFERADRQEMLEAGVTANTIRMGCTPVVNLFGQVAEPILLDAAKFEYAVTPDTRRRDSLEIFSIDEVVRTSQASGGVSTVEPFYSFRHARAEGKPSCFWSASRRPVFGQPDAPSQMMLMLVDLKGNLLRAEDDTLTLRCTCTDGDLPSRLPFGSEEGDFTFEGAAAIQRVVCLRKPTRSLRPQLGGAASWRLVSHLSLNYLSLVEEGREALQEILKLYEGGLGSHLDHQIEGITAIASSRQSARVLSDHGVTYVRGMQVEMELNEERFVGGGAYLFSAVIEHFLAQYVGLNSFSQLSVRTKQRKEELRRWPPRAGNRILL